MYKRQLTDRETETLFRILKELKNEGITIIYISHRLEEIFKLTDSVSVMRDGKMIVTKKTSELTTDQLVSYMIGRELKNMYPDIEMCIRDRRYTDYFSGNR